MSPKYEILHEFCYNTQKTPDISALMYAFPAIFYFYVGVVVAAAAAIDVAVAMRRGASHSRRSNFVFCFTPRANERN